MRVCGTGIMTAVGGGLCSIFTLSITNILIKQLKKLRDPKNLEHKKGYRKLILNPQLLNIFSHTLPHMSCRQTNPTNFAFKGLTENSSSKKDSCPYCPLLRTERKKRDLNSSADIECRHCCLQLSAGVAYLLSKLHKILVLQFFKVREGIPVCSWGMGGREGFPFYSTSEHQLCCPVTAFSE